MRPGRNLLWCAALLALVSSAAAAPDEDLLGKAAGYPVGTRGSWFYDESVRVGSFSNLDGLLPHYTLQKGGIAVAAARGRSRIEDRVPVQGPDLHAR